MKRTVSKRNCTCTVHKDSCLHSTVSLVAQSPPPQNFTSGGGTWVVCSKSKAESREPGTSVLCMLILLFSLSHVLYNSVNLPRSPSLTSYSVIAAVIHRYWGLRGCFTCCGCRSCRDYCGHCNHDGCCIRRGCLRSS